MHFELSNKTIMSCRCVKTMCSKPLKRPLPADELLTALSPLLDEVDGTAEATKRRGEIGNIPVLLEENARLRKLAIQLSNLLGDLPEKSALRPGSPAVSRYMRTTRSGR